MALSKERYVADEEGKLLGVLLDMKEYHRIPEELRKKVMVVDYVVDEEGKRLGVLLDMENYRWILKEWEELETLRAYDLAIASGDESIPLEQAIQEIEREHQ